MADRTDRNIWEVVKARSSIDYELSETQDETSRMENKIEKGSVEVIQDEHGTTAKQKKEQNGCDSSQDYIVLLNGDQRSSPIRDIKREILCNGGKTGINLMECSKSDIESNGTEENHVEKLKFNALDGGSSVIKEDESEEIVNRPASPELSFVVPLKKKYSISDNSAIENCEQDSAKENEKAHETEGAFVESHSISTGHSSVTESVVIQSVVTRPTYDVTTKTQPTLGTESTGHVVYAHGMATPLAASSETHVIHSAVHGHRADSTFPFPFTERLRKLSKLAEVRTEPEQVSATVVNGTKNGDHAMPSGLSQSPNVMTCGQVDSPVVNACNCLPTSFSSTSTVQQLSVSSVSPPVGNVRSSPMATVAMPRRLNAVSPISSKKIAFQEKSLGAIRTERFQQTDCSRHQLRSPTLNTNLSQAVTQRVTHITEQDVTQSPCVESINSKVMASNTVSKFDHQTVVSNRTGIKPSNHTNIFGVSSPRKDVQASAIATPPEHFRLYPILVNNQNRMDTFIPVTPLTIRHAVPPAGYFDRSKSNILSTNSAPTANVMYRYPPVISNYTAFRPVRRLPSNNQLFQAPGNIAAQWDKKIGALRDLSCRERMQPSPELKVSERQFRPVSPNLKTNIITVVSSAVSSKSNFQPYLKREASSSDMIHVRLTHGSQGGGVETDRRGSVEQEVDVSGLSYSLECALNDSCESPLATVLQSRCNSPIPFGTSPKSCSKNSSRNSTTDNKSIETESNDTEDSRDISISESSGKELVEIASENCDTTDSVAVPVQKRKRSNMNIISKRLEARLPSPVKERVDVDLFRDPRELTREERALQRAMLMFCEMEMKEKVKAENQTKRTRRKLRRRSKSKSRDILGKKATGKPKFKTFKEKQKDWVSKQIKMRVKSTEDATSVEIKPNSTEVKRPLVDNVVKLVRPAKLENKVPTEVDGVTKPVRPAKLENKIPAENGVVSKPVRPAKQENNTSTENGAVIKPVAIKRKRSSCLDGENEMRKKKRRLSEVKQQCLDESVRAKNIKQKLPMNSETLKQRRQSDGTTTNTAASREKLDGVRQPLGGTITAGKRKRCLEDERRIKSVKRARLRKQQLEHKPKVMFCDVKNHSTQEKKIMTEQEKAERSHRVKTYMLVASYPGFKDFKPVVLESRTRGRSRPGDTAALLEGKQAVTVAAPPAKPANKPEFPLLVVEEVHSKPVKETLIAENEKLCSIWKESLKAQGKWHGDDLEKLNEEEFMDEESLKEAKRLSVNRNTGETILHKAARLGYHDTVRRYIHEGAEPSAKDNAGWTPLHEACARGKLGVVKVLTRYGADVNACSNDGIRPIHDAAEGCQIDVLRLLLSYGADPLLATYAGNTALMCAKEKNTRKFLQGLLGDLMLQDSSNELPSNDEDCWEFAGSSSIFNEESKPESISGIFEGAPDWRDIGEPEFEASEKPHLPTYNLPVVKNGFVIGRRNYVLVQDVLERLGWVRQTLLKRCKSRLEIREMPWSEFLEEISRNQFCLKPKHVPAGPSSEEPIAELIPLTYSLRSILGIRIETVKR